MKQLHFRYEMELMLDREVAQHHFLVRCRPMEDHMQRCIWFSRRIAPADTIDEVRDGFGNVGFAGVAQAPHDRLRVEAEGTVAVDRTLRGQEVCHPMYRCPSVYTMPDDAIRGFLAEVESEFGSACASQKGLAYLMDRLYGRFVYAKGFTSVKTTAAQAWSGGKGVCQDYAHIFLCLCRLAGVPARYVAGMMLGEGETHAWTEVWLENGWIGMDPTNNRMVDETYIKLAHGRDFADGAVDKGCFLGFAGQKQQIYVKVEELV